ncbi:MAG: hypothetical protein EUB_02799 [Eubacterium sp.]|uniref:BppU family phage baseplate upper protein n=1 Tax=Eubacterium sp. TaxID=142586 RepID=UPI00306F3FA6
MNIITTEITIDLYRQNPWIEIDAKQYDNKTRHLLIHLTNNGAPYTIPSGTIIRFQGTKRDGRQVMYDCPAPINNKIDVELTEQVLACEGPMNCEIFLTDNTSDLRSANFVLNIEKAALSRSDIISSDDYQSIDKIKADTLQYKKDAEAAKNASEAAKEAATKSANTATQQAQTAQLEAQKVQQIVAGNEAYTKTESDLKYTVAPRKEASSDTGELKLTDADEGLSYLELQGNSEQYAATGTNLFDVKQLIKNMQAISPANITIEQNSYGKFMHIANNIWHRTRCLEFTNDITKTYKIGLKARSVSATPGGFYFALIYKDGSGLTLGNITNQTQYTEISGTIPSGKEIDYLYFSFADGVSYYDVLLDSFYLYPEDAPSTEKPTGGYGTPSPEYPSEVKSVGDIPKDVNGVEIRNILDIESAIAAPDSEWTVTGNNIFALPIRVEKRRINGTLLESLTSPFVVGISKSNTQLVTGDGFYLNKDKINGFDFSSESKVYFLVYTGTVEYQLSDVKEMLKNSITKIMVTYAAEIDEYRPYIGGNNGLVKLESIGINHVNANNKLSGFYHITTVNEDGSRIKSIQDSANYSSRYVAYFNYKKNTQYSLYCRCWYEGETGKGESTIQIRDASGVLSPIKSALVQNIKSDLFYTFNTRDNSNLGVWIYVQSVAGQPIRTMYVEDLMIVEGEKTLQEMQALKFQPYYQQITWIPLKEPLRKVTGSGTHQDYIDQDGLVKQCVLKYIFDGSIGGIYGGPTKEDLIGFSVNVENLSVRSDRAVWCNKLAYLNTPSNAISEGCAEANTTVTVVVKKSRLESVDLAGFKKWLSDQYRKGDPIIAYPATTTPITYQIPAVYIETHDPETNVRCMNKVKPSDMTLDYKIAMSSLIKRLEALESKTVQEV